MKVIKDEIRRHLVATPGFRERKNKYKGIARLIVDECPPLGDLDRGTLIGVFIKFTTMNRVWNKILQDEPELRGTDYGDKDVLEQEVELELGYTPGFEQDKKKLQTLEDV